MASTRVLSLNQSQRLLKLDREKRTRNNTAYIIRDMKTGTVLLSQKLQHASDFINTYLAADAKRERVSVQSLHEAIDTVCTTDDNRVDGFHKMRYKITRCPVHTAHIEFDQARKQPDVNVAVIVTASPSCYTVTRAAV
jgi:hypothetical protein